MVSFALYRLLTTLGGPAIALLLRRRLARGKEDPLRFNERLGVPGRPRPRGPLVWLHGASLGEAGALLPLIERLAALRPDLSFLLTTGTVSSARVMGERLPAPAFHQFLPVDTPAAARRFLDHWHPDLVLWSESDLWPNLLIEASRRAIPRVLLNGRMSPRSHATWRLGRPLASRMLEGFSLCLGQTEGDAARLADLGAPRTACLGNLKLAAPPPGVDEHLLAAARAAIGTRPLWLAASTHPGEEALIARVHQRLKARHPGLLSVIVPRHAERAPEIARALAAQGLEVGQRTSGWPTPATDIWIGDTMGEMGLYFRLAPVVVMGKTFPESGSRTGGQNPLEPALLDSALLWGPGMSNFTDIAQGLRTAGGAWEVANADALADALSTLLADPDQRARLAHAAHAWASGETAVLDRVVQALAPFLEALPAAGPRREAAGANP
ncbi:3-deoxy-D-manno-octulosonic acid transferase [Pararhodospirillum oryzae]|uniref:3-deoxy-D-manno-octulosonic acid transferase n=1 Tax=Pararhodospirillum oryzae TaxID=478448 RepID=A0A512H8D5_9PROT|nr:3-deoxy-D-manno-octulosonic acid transferase [Pararhodospirillum oryzae]GEO81707.1 3-deoxy-D-manno-octulosonic acid transferase [Pararhodospirillum oryzae]